MKKLYEEYYEYYPTVELFESLPYSHPINLDPPEPEIVPRDITREEASKLAKLIWGR
jgi:hypothetical protein